MVDISKAWKPADVEARCLGVVRILQQLFNDWESFMVSMVSIIQIIQIIANMIYIRQGRVFKSWHRLLLAIEPRRAN